MEHLEYIGSSYCYSGAAWFRSFPYWQIDVERSVNEYGDVLHRFFLSVYFSHSEIERCDFEDGGIQSPDINECNNLMMMAIARKNIKITINY